MTTNTHTDNHHSSNSSAWKSVYRSDLFTNKVVLVTGGGTGIGFSISKELASLGATVIISSRSLNICQAAAAEINKSLLVKGSGGKVVAGPAMSLRDESSIVELIEFIVSKYKRLDMLVNNAGGQFVCSAEEMSRNGFSAVVETNLTGTFLVCREAYNQYMRDHGGSIVNITIGNRNGMPNMSHSAAARAGVENLTATLCSEWVESDVRINCVRPGIIWTESGFKNYGAMGDAFVDKILPSLPSKRFGTPEEISSAVCWLLSEGASFVTGATVCVDGGGSYHFLPFVDIDDSAHLPIYGTLPTKGKL